MEIKFKRDTAFRKSFFVPDSFSHPAKMDAQLLIWLVERYSKEGETILDPMAGSGTTMLACTLGRNVVLIELEEKFCKMMIDNWEQVRMRPQLGSEMGDCQIIQGDARGLEGLFDKIVTSPPYSEGLGHQHRQYGRDIEASKSIQAPEYSGHPSNIGNLPYGNIDSIITSPPYEGTVSDDKEGPGAGGSEHRFGRWKKGTAKKHSYTQHGEPVDAVITSPPYEESLSPDRHKLVDGNGIGKRDPKLAGTGQYEISQKDNIGNLKGDTYLSAMLEVYKGCHSVLKPAGLMILVTKNFLRNQEEVRLDTDTISLCQMAGFQLLERHYRLLPSQSFWRIIYMQKYPSAPVIDKEDILVFEKT